MIANIAYSDRKDLGNGSMESNDGWNYRGRELFKLRVKKNMKLLIML